MGVKWVEAARMWQRVQVVTWHALEQGGDSENEAEVGVGSGWLR